MKVLYNKGMKCPLSIFKYFMRQFAVNIKHFEKSSMYLKLSTEDI
jgi:hypothetical protein